MSRVYNVVDSVKGGCGKTTFSIMLSAQLDKTRGSRSLKVEKKEEPTEGNNKETKDEDAEKRKEYKCCLLDMDFLGTSMISLFDLEGKSHEILPESEVAVYLNEAMRGYKVEGKRWIWPVCLGKSGEAKFYIGFSDPDFQAKGEYRCDPKFNYIPATKLGVFRYGLSQILERGNLEKQCEGDVKYIVFDLPPSNDIYSETVISSMIDKNKHVLKEGDRCNYFLMMGMDLSHLNATKSYLIDFLSGENKLPDKIFIVFNDWLLKQKINDKGRIDEEAPKRAYELCNARKEDIVKTLSAKISDQSILKRIYFCDTARCLEYMECVQGTKSAGLRAPENDADELFRFPIDQCIKWEERFVEKSADKPADKPADKSADEATDKPVDEPSDKPTDEPSDKSAKKSVDKALDMFRDKFIDLLDGKEEKKDDN